MMNLSAALQNVDLGYTPFVVQRITYRRQNGRSVPSERRISTAGCIQPGTPEMMQLLPQEDRREDFIAVYTGFSLSAGENEGGETYTAADRILWRGETYRVVRVKDWSSFGYTQAYAVLLQEGES